MVATPTRAQCGISPKQATPYLAWLVVCVAALTAGIVTAFLVSGRVHPLENLEPPVVREAPGTSTRRQAGTADSADPLLAPVNPVAVPDGDVMAERVADVDRTTGPLDPDDVSYLREDGAGSHIDGALDPDDESAMHASRAVSNIGDHLDPDA